MHATRHLFPACSLRFRRVSEETGTNPTREITSTAKRGVQPVGREARAAQEVVQAAVTEEAREDPAEVVVAVEVADLVTVAEVEVVV